jgi:hypothetical protein
MQDVIPESGRLAHGHPDDELVHGLEPDQVVAVASQSLPRYRLTPIANLALWLLRIFVLLITLTVVYTFIVNLH